jgi:hypothetical protein
MKNLLFILTVLLCTVSCSKENVSPTVVKLTLPELLVSHEWFRGSDIMVFKTNNTFTRTFTLTGKFATGTYNATNTTLNLNQTNGSSNAFINVKISNNQDTIYVDIDKNNTNIAYLTK